MDYSKLGYDVTCFLGIFLLQSSLYDSVVKKLKEIPEINAEIKGDSIIYKNR